MENITSLESFDCVGDILAKLAYDGKKGASVIHNTYTDLVIETVWSGF